MSEPDPYESPDDDDPILAELWRVRDEIAASFGYDSQRQHEHFMRAQYLVGSDVVSRSKSGELEAVFKGSGKLNLDCLKAPPLETPVIESGEPQDA